MRVADEAEMLEALKNAHELSRIGVNVIRKDVFVDRPARRCVNTDEPIRAYAHRQISQKLPAIGATLHVGIILELLSRPKTRRLGAAVEVERLIKYREIVISHE